MSPKDKQSQVQPIESPNGLGLHPQPEKPARVSRRAAAIVLGIVVAVLIGYIYGGYRRTAKNEAETRQAGLLKTVSPASQAAAEFVGAIPPGNAPVVRQGELQPPPDPKQPKPQSCGTDRQTGNPYRYNPQTGQPCEVPQERVVVRQAAPRQQAKPAETRNEPTPEEQAAAVAYQLEREARLSPIAASGAHSLTTPAAQIPAGDMAMSPLPDLGQLLTRNPAANPSPADAIRAPGASSDDYETQNMQPRKQAFLNSAADRQKEDYLRSVRVAPLSRYEIKAGWEIPAVLEQSLNSDLPGELKALVSTNVYDTATGMYLLVPQGSRLTGQYDSRISYGQNGVQVIWNRIVFPDASTIDLNGMVGLDSHGNAGLRDRVDRHYKRLLGFSVLTSMFTAAFAISQQRNQSILVNPNPGQIAAGAVGEELSQTGSQITRRNLNVQPTIEVRAGYRFTVRVNRDILFEAPYQAEESGPPSTGAVH